MIVLKYITRLYVSLCLCVIEHSFVFRKPNLNRLYSHPTLVVHSRFRNLIFYLKMTQLISTGLFTEKHLYTIKEQLLEESD